MHRGAPRRISRRAGPDRASAPPGRCARFLAPTPRIREGALDDPDSVGPFSRPILVERTLKTGQPVTVEANEEERAALARDFGLPGITRLTGTFRLSGSLHRLQVTGTVEAAVTQTCSVTLEPFDGTVSEEVDVDFAAPTPSRARRPRMPTSPTRSSTAASTSAASPPSSWRSASTRTRENPASPSSRRRRTRRRNPSRRSRASRARSLGKNPGTTAEDGRTTKRLQNSFAAWARVAIFRRAADPCSRVPGGSERLFDTPMSQRVRISLDAMGGDHGPSTVVPGAGLARERHPETTFLMFGDEAVLTPWSRPSRA